jgi:hypothetical protein
MAQKLSHGPGEQPMKGLVTSILILLLLVTATTGSHWVPWIFMWTIAFEMYALFKWITLAYNPLSASIQYPADYLLTWVGMDPLPFSQKSQVRSQRAYPYLFSGLLNLLMGVFFIWAAEIVPSRIWILQGWMICMGLAFVLHFGLFRILVGVHRIRGFDVEPIMQNPLMAKTISEFWGGRWNVAFKQLVYPFVYRPLKNRMGPALGLSVTFLLSGLIHEVAISLPAKGGGGLPTLYFLLQPVGIFFERTGFYASLAPFLQRIVTYVFVAGPAFILFHPQFMRIVILPFGRALGLQI